MTDATDTPAPGSDRAFEQGCTCPVVDNARGRGVGGEYIVAGDCPLHGTEEAADA